MNVRDFLPDLDEGRIAMLTGLLFALAFPPVPLLLPAFLCLVPLAVGVARRADGAGTLQGAMRLGFWTSLVAYALTLYWIAVALLIFTKLALLGYVGALLWLGIVTALAVAGLFAARRATRWPMAVLLPVVWVAYEFALNYTADLAFPWLPLGLATAPFPLLAQVADLSGVRGISFWIAATNGLLADAWLVRTARGALWRGAAIAGMAGAVVLYGWWRLETTELRPLAPMAVIQPNIPQEEKWQEENRDRIVGILAELTRAEVQATDAQVVVWPEVALPGYLSQHPEWVDSLRVLAAADSTPILFGVLDVRWDSPTQYEYYNAAMLTDAAGELGAQPAYHKGYLVPVVERVPFLNPRWFGNLRYFGGFGRGDPVLFEMPFGEGGVLICFESVFPQRSLAYRREGGDVLVNITNDAWFGRTVAPYQHAAHMVLRSIENRVGAVRSANTGISGYVDPLGRWRDATPLFVRDARTYAVETTDVRTLYVTLGDWIGLLCVLGTFGLAGLYIYRSRTGRFPS